MRRKGELWNYFVVKIDKFENFKSYYFNYFTCLATQIFTWSTIIICCDL